MSQILRKYCLDSNVLIQAWQKYYSPKYCLTYWNILNELGSENRIFFAEMVYNEITTTDDNLSNWLKTSNIKVRLITSEVTQSLSSIYITDPNHKFLVDNKKSRSLADPWVIAHAMVENAVVVTKEKMVTASNSKKIKIPNVCQNMGVNCIHDFEMINQLNLSFTCHR